MNEIINYVSSVGFPIVMCIYMITTIKDMQTLHKSEIDELRKTIENNTLAINEMINKVGVNNGQY